MIWGKLHTFFMLLTLCCYKSNVKLTTVFLSVWPTPIIYPLNKSPFSAFLFLHISIDTWQQEVSSQYSIAKSTMSIVQWEVSYSIFLIQLLHYLLHRMKVFYSSRPVKMAVVPSLCEGLIPPSQCTPQTLPQDHAALPISLLSSVHPETLPRENQSTSPSISQKKNNNNVNSSKKICKHTQKHIFFFFCPCSSAVQNENNRGFL